MSKQLEHYGYWYTPLVDCKYEWAGECTPEECNFVYCEYNANRIFAVSSKIVKSKLLGGSFEDLSPELQEIVSKKGPYDTDFGLIKETVDTSEKRMDEKQ